MRADTDSDRFLSELYQLREEFSDLGEVVSIERLTMIILDAFPAEKYSTIKIQEIRYLDLSLVKIEAMIKMIINNYKCRQFP